MKIKPYEPADRDRVLALQKAHGETFLHHDPDDPLNRMCILLEDDDGTLVGAAYGRLNLEGYLMVDNTRGTERDRWGWIRTLFEEGARTAYNAGIGEEHFWIPTKLRGYARRIARLPGVVQESRYSYTVDLRGRYVG